MSRQFVATTLLKQQGGFSLVELVTVMVLVGILTATIAPKFSSRQGFSDYAARDQIVVAARIAQQRAMYDRAATSCYRLVINSNTISAQHGSYDSGTGVFNYQNIGPTEDWLNGVAIESGATVAPVTVYFNGLGSALGTSADCSGTATQTDIPVISASNIGVRVYATGYIQAY